MTIRRELIDELLKDYETPQDIQGEGGQTKERGSQQKDATATKQVSSTSPSNWKPA